MSLAGAVIGLAISGGLGTVPGLGAWFDTPAAQAQGIQADLQRLNDLTRTAETFEIMRLEGLQNDKSLAEDLFGDPDNPTWQRSLEQIYATNRMIQIYTETMSKQLEQDTKLVSDVTIFLDSDLGKRVIGLELEARRTALDPIALGAAREIFAEMQQTDKDRLALIDRLVTAGDLMESNVSTALNANVAFSRALAAADGVGGGMDEEDMLANAWSQEPAIREAVADFLYPLMALAYAPLTMDELATYVEFHESDIGRRLNLALMKSFEPVMIDLSSRLGAEAGRLMSGQEL